MKRWMIAAALALPLVGLAGAVAVREARLQGAEPWVIPVTGYDPRDPLRGRYIRFVYAWQVAGDARICTLPGGCQLCLSRSGETVTATVIRPADACDDRVDPGRSSILVTPGVGDEPPRFGSRIFVSETSAPAIEMQLRRGPMRVRTMLTDDGRLVLRSIEPID